MCDVAIVHVTGTCSLPPALHDASGHPHTLAVARGLSNAQLGMPTQMRSNRDAVAAAAQKRVSPGCTSSIVLWSALLKATPPGRLRCALRAPLPDATAKGASPSSKKFQSPMTKVHSVIG